MLKILVSMFLTLFLHNAVADDLAVLDQDLKLLKSNLVLLSDKIVLTEEELVMLEHIDMLMSDVRLRVMRLSSEKLKYEAHFPEIEAIRTTISINQSNAGFKLGELNEKSFLDKARLEVKSVNNTRYVFNEVACPDKFSLDKWQALSIFRRQIHAIRCSIEASKGRVYAHYKEYLVDAPLLSGEILISFYVDEKGNIVVKKATSNLPGSLITSIVDEFKVIKTPVLDIKKIHVEYTFTFLPE